MCDNKKYCVQNIVIKCPLKNLLTTLEYIENDSEL